MLKERQERLDDNSMLTEWRALNAALKQDRRDPELLALTYSGLASALGADGQVDTALAAAKEAERIAQTAGLQDRPSHGFVLTMLSYKETNAGQVEAGYAHGTAAVEAFRRLGDEESWSYGRAVGAAGIAAYGLGLYQQSERDGALTEALAIRCLPADDLTIARKMSSHAVDLGAAGRRDEALAKQFEAVGWGAAHLPESHYVYLYMLNNLGAALRDAGRLDEAKAVLRRAADLGRQYHPDEWFMRSQSLMKLGDVLAMEGHDREAEALWLAVEDFRARAKDRRSPTDIAAPYRSAAAAAERRGDIPLALARRDAALQALTVAPNDHPEVARARVEKAGTLLLAHRQTEAVAIVEPAIAIIRKKWPLSDPGRQLAEITYARIVAETAGSEVGYQIAAPVAAALEATLLDPDTNRTDLVRLVPYFVAAFGTTTELALQTGRTEEAFRGLQLANLSTIVQVTSEVAARAVESESEARALIVRMQDAVRNRRELDEARIHALASKRPADSEVLRHQIVSVDADIVAIRSSIDARYPALRTLGRPGPVRLETYRANLAANEILLAPLPVEDGTLAIAVTRDGLIWRKTAPTSAAIAPIVARIRGSIADAQLAGVGTKQFDRIAARKIYDALIPPAFATSMASHSSLLYYASRDLAALPPALLIAPRHTKSGLTQWLIRSHAITVMPTLSVPPKRVARFDTATPFLGVGAPLPARSAQTGAAFALHGGRIETGNMASLAQLPAAANELRAMRSLLDPHGQKVLASADATEIALKTMALGGFRVIAFATHAIDAGDAPGLLQPALVMTPPPTPHGDDDGLLTASEIAKLRLDADWVILSACNTASGGSGDGETYAGLAAAFVRAGARSLLVSHWPVRDDAAARLTVDTVRGAAAGKSRADALQHAMLRLMADTHVPGAANPAIWAPFVLVGS